MLQKPCITPTKKFLVVHIELSGLLSRWRVHVLNDTNHDKGIHIYIYILIQHQYRVLYKNSNSSLWYIFDILQQTSQ